MEAAAKSNLKPVSLELGGKSPLVIFDDADIDKAVDIARDATFFNKACASFILFGETVIVQLPGMAVLGGLVQTFDIMTICTRPYKKYENNNSCNIELDN